MQPHQKTKPQLVIVPGSDGRIWSNKFEVQKSMVQIWYQYSLSWGSCTVPVAEKKLTARLTGRNQGGGKT